jgi:dTDP-4-amino-4,6-dideoxygalactose transaminase
MVEHAWHAFQELIPGSGIQRETEALNGQLVAAFERVSASGSFILGPEVMAFEEEMASYLGVDHAVAVGSGTAALVLALRGAGIEPGDHVITPSFTFFATAEAIVAAGATPVLVDIEDDSFNIDPVKIEEILDDRSPVHRRLGVEGRSIKAILPVHLFGRAADMGSIEKIARDADVRLIEDTAQALGARSSDRFAGTIGDAGCYSFFPTKNLGGLGDGGLVVSNDPAIVGRVASLRVHGSTRKYVHEDVGMNSRLDALHAALLRVKLPYLDEWLSQRRAHARVFDEAFQELPGIVPPSSGAPGQHTYNQYTIRVGMGMRDSVREALSRAGIASNLYYPLPLHLQPALRSLGYARGDLPRSERACDEVLSIPIFPSLTADERDLIVRVIQGAVGAAA